MTQYYYPYLVASESSTIVITDLQNPAVITRTFNFELPANLTPKFIPIEEFPSLTLTVIFEGSNDIFFDVDDGNLIFHSDNLGNLELISNTSEGYSLGRSGASSFEVKLELDRGIRATYFFTLTSDAQSLTIRLITIPRSVPLPNPNTLVAYTRLLVPVSLELTLPIMSTMRGINQ